MKFSRVHELRGQMDKPTLNLVRHMRERNYLAPDGWEGCRPLQ